MPTPPLDPALAREAHEAWERHGGRKTIGARKAAAEELGVSPQTLLDRASKYIDPAIQDSMDAAGTGMIPALAWVKKDGYSVLLKPDTSVSPDDILQRIRDAFEGMQPAEPVIPPEKVMSDLCNVFPLFDVHWGMKAWGDETGGPDYDLELARSDMIQAFERVLSLTPFADKGILIIGGDFFHADDNNAQTPAHKHNLDVASRMFRVVDTAIHALGYVIGRIQSRHKDVLVRVLRGNHDEHAHNILTFALSERYRNDSQVTVEKDPRDLFMSQWGNAAIFAHHGDKGTATDFVLKLADVCPFWSSCRHRYAYTGHRHKMGAERIGGLMWERLDAFCPPDAYGATWANRRAFKADTYDRNIGRVLTAMDPIDRASL